MCSDLSRAELCLSKHCYVSNHVESRCFAAEALGSGIAC